MLLPSQRKNLMTLKLISVFFLFFLTSFVFLPALQPAAAEELTVSAAISLKNAFEDIGRQFEKSHPGIKVLFNFGASGDLVRSDLRPVPRWIYLPPQPPKTWMTWIDKD